MNEAIETINYKNHTIEIFPDETNFSPRENDNICKFHIAHKRYSFGDVNHNDLESILEAEQEAISNKDIILPLYMYDHSGITISLSPFSCPWDSGQVGIVIISRKKMIEEFSSKIFYKKLKQRAVEIAEAEVKEMDQYLTGEVYGYVIDDNKESCWGYYGQEYCVEEAKYVVDYIVGSEADIN